MRGWILAAAALAVATAGCGQEPTPAEAVPALSQQLDDVDAAISSRRYGAARAALDDLVAETERARADGTLDAADADAILAAISSLDGQLPELSNPSPTASTTPSPSPSAEPPSPGKPHPKAHKKPHPKPPKPKPHIKPHPKPGHGHRR